MGENKESEAGKIEQKRKNDAGKPIAVIDERCDEKDGYAEHQENDLPAPHLFEIGLFSHVCGAVNSDDPKYR
jgi:hypothetical protein